MPVDAFGQFIPSGKKRHGHGELSKRLRLDAGQDIHAAAPCVIPARSSAVISTDLYVQVPAGYVGLIWSRSGLSIKHKLEVGAGCIDSGYTGEVKVHLYNHGNQDYTINTRDKIAQLLTLPVNLNPYEEVTELPQSERGENGFGSSGR
jgi:dUTP pyrophosphatase